MNSIVRKPLTTQRILASRRPGEKIYRTIKGHPVFILGNPWVNETSPACGFTQWFEVEPHSNGTFTAWSVVNITANSN